MPRAQGKTSTAINDKDVPRFAPNFTVYVLPPDAVCLYSEDRKFFLYGELYCKLAAAIGAGGKSVRKLVRELETEFPAEKIREAMHRLFDRRYVLRDSRTAGDIATAYWLSLGLSPQTAEKNLQNCRVRVESIAVQGGKELTAALRKLGVRLVDRAADLTVTLVGDYLDGHLADLNKRHLADRTRWLLAQPNGIFPLVGPIFAPGKSACWTCLADRMRRNREVKALIERKGARRVAVSPLARQPFGQTGVQLAALEIAKAIATDFRTDLDDHIISLDLLGSSVVKHYVARRPQCPSCGAKKLRDPRRAAAPVTLATGNKLVMTSGGYRSVSSRDTVARFRKHVSPLTGVVSRLERIEADLPMNTNFYAQHNFSAPAFSVAELRAGLGGGSFGKGSTAEQGEASALMEAMERYSGIFQGDEIRTTRRFTDFSAGEAIAPNDVLLFSDTQYRQRHMQIPGQNHDPSPPPPEPFDPSAEIEWSPVWSFRDGRFKYLPTSLLYFFYRGPGQINTDSNGCAAGNTLEEAIVQGYLELIERDSYAIWWYNRSQREEVDLSQFDDSYIHNLRTQLAEAGRRLWVLDITSDLGIPTYVGIAHWLKDGKENIEFGSGAHFDPQIAMLRTLTELNQFLAIGLMGGGSGDKSSLDGTTPLRLEDHPYLVPGKKLANINAAGAKFGGLSSREQAEACVRLTAEAGLDFMVLDQTRADIGVPVIRVIAPGLRHFYRRFAPGRLYDVPVKLGLRDRPIAESDLNPIHPHS
ncbi:MAG TPA: TOMM precursor leader peptide-binding protein [Xanthobacteraceae bacterium]|jgi:ribosomal protein S12 methylthiotransferase accessory factor